MRSDAASLLDIADCARAAISYIEGMDEASFLKDRKTQKAVICEIQIIGEATKRLSMEFRHAHPEISWAVIAGTRDKLIHDYDQVNLELIWSVVSKQLPPLLKQLEPLLPPAPGADS
ncbi:MAG: DUF86 domain-containing protein [bacterium]